MAEETNKPGVPETHKPSTGTEKPRQNGTYRNGVENTKPSFIYLNQGQEVKLKEKYKVVNTISHQTGEAFVYLCSNTRLNKRVILKLYNPGKAPKKEILDILIEHHDPDVVKVFEHGYIGSQFCEVMEYAEGGNLQNRLKLKPYTEEEIIRIMPEILRGLEFFHRHNIVHRDIKPSNLFYREINEQDVILGDVGSASILGELSQKPSEAAFTLSFAPPEAYGVFDKDKNMYVALISKEGDFYSLGITLLCLLGYDPFVGLIPAHIQHKKVAEEREKLIPQGLSDNFKHLLRGLLTRVRKKRWGASEIEKWLNDEEVHVYEDHFDEHKPKINPY